MSQENVETTTRAYAALNRGDVPAVLEFCDPEVVFDNSNAVFDPGVYQGREGVREFFSQQAGMWQSQRWEPEEVLPVGDDQVLVSHRIVSVGRDGVETIARNTNVYTLNGGKATHIKSFQTKAAALEAAGLRE
jgi:ketosteroid isomerase-like protein